MMDFILENWEAILLALMVAARAIFSLLPSDAPAVKVFGWIDTIITTLVGGDKRKNNNNNN
jgi:hypothetical protein|tara:strand:+ start:615 stop:797 length:183 start_codon:yes stop_codon:yes gene_type:complete